MEQLGRSSSPGGHESQQLLAFFLLELRQCIWPSSFSSMGDLTIRTTDSRELVK